MASVLAFALAASNTPASAQTGSSGTSTGQNPASQQSSSTTTRAEKRDRRRRRSSATLGCGLCRPRRSWRTVSGRSRGYRRGTNYIQGYTNVGDFAGTFAVGIRDRAEIFTLVPVRHAHRPRRAADLRRQQHGVRQLRRIAIRGSIAIWTGDNVGRLGSSAGR